MEKLALTAGVQIGWAAKMVNMLLKVRVFIAREGDPSLPNLIHPPIDNLLIDAIRRAFPSTGLKAELRKQIVGLCSTGKPISGITTYEQYLKVIEGLRMAARARMCSLFEIEALWSGDISSL